MTTATKAIAGIGGLLATATVPSTYLVISSSSGNGEEASKVDNRKTGSQWLLGSGYTSNKPTFQSQNSLKHGCSENLFSNDKETFDPTQDQKIYGCAVMGMELGNTGVKWVSQDPKWVKFNSEVAVRKGDEGWVINSRVDNWSSVATNFDYVLTTYKYKGNRWEKEGEPRLWFDAISMGNYAYVKNQSDSEGKTINELMIHNDKLVVKVPGESWFNGADLISPTSSSPTKTKQSIKIKSWSGVWIEDADKEETSWIFGDIELYAGEKKYSQIFCKGGENECFQSKVDVGSAKKPTESDTWSQATTGSNYASEKAKDVAGKTVKGIIEKLKDSKGSWAKLEDICEAKVDETPDEERQKQLRMYCSKGKKVN